MNFKEQEKIKKKKKALDVIFTTSDFDDFWKALEVLFKGGLFWDGVQELIKNNPEKEVKQFFGSLRGTPFEKFLKESRENGEIGAREEKATLEFGEIILDALRKKDYWFIAYSLFVTNVRRIAEAKKIKLPEKFENFKYDRDFLPFLDVWDGDLMLMFTAQSSLVYFPISEKLGKLNLTQSKNLLAFLLAAFFEVSECGALEEEINYKNPKRQKQIDFLMDKNRPARDKYYEILESVLRKGLMKKLMAKLIEKDPYFFDPYMTLAGIYNEEENYEEAESLIHSAFLKALEMIVDKDGNWPKHIEWGYLENRHIVRAIDQWARILWERGRSNYAFKIFRNLLKSNYRDNIGARYEMLAILLGHESDWMDEEFATEMEGCLDARKSEEWFQKYAKKIPEEFGWWFKKVEEEEKKESGK